MTIYHRSIWCEEQMKMNDTDDRDNRKNDNNDNDNNNNNNTGIRTCKRLIP